MNRAYNPNADDATWDRDWMMTFTGRHVFPLALKPEDVDIRDIAHHTAMQVRYNGSVRVFYSVAEHMIHVSEAIHHMTGDRMKALQGLLHDANETYTGDMIRPVKNSLKENFAFWKQMEDNNERAICEKFGIPFPLDPIVKECDKRIIVNEKMALFGKNKPWDWNYEPLEIKIAGWDWADAEKFYLEAFGFLTGNYEAFDECFKRRGPWDEANY
jgi:hypothetical protein